MPKIQPFKALLPHPNKVKKVVLTLENLSIPSAKEIRAKNPASFINLLIPKIENPYLRGSKQEIAFKSINENLEDFIQKAILIKDTDEAIYIYQQQKNNRTYTGICTGSSVEDYLNNQIKKHEITIPEREKVLMEYLQQTGIDSNPVLITYPENPIIEKLLAHFTKQKPILSFQLDQVQHQVWSVNKTADILQFVTAFHQMESVYIADGHHRAAATTNNAIKFKERNPNHNGNEAYNFFLSVYISTNQLDILPFHRFLKLENELNLDDFLSKIATSFKSIEIKKEDLIPQQKHHIGIYAEGKAFQIQLPYETNNVLANLDVSLLQHYILEPIFGIENSRTDHRISFIGGENTLDKLMKLIDQNIYDVAFFLYPITVNNLMEIADLSEIMPPKSTWFEPKFLAGLITRLI